MRKRRIMRRSCLHSSWARLLRSGPPTNKRRCNWAKLFFRFASVANVTIHTAVLCTVDLWIAGGHGARAACSSVRARYKSNVYESRLEASWEPPCHLQRPSLHVCRQQTQMQKKSFSFNYCCYSASSSIWLEIAATSTQWPNQLILVSFYYFDAPRAPSF